MKQCILFAVMVVTVYACVSIHSNFTYYKEKPFIKGESHIIRLDGIYFIKNSKSKFPTSFMFLYADGSVYISNLGGSDIDSMFWSNPNEYLSFLEHKWPSLKPTADNFWGSYKVRKDSIYIQYFCLNYDYWMKRNTIELQGVVKNDNTILIIDELCSWCHTLHPSLFNESGINSYNPSIEYRFHRSIFKPDSSAAWFKTQSWYKEWVKKNKQ